MAGRPKPPPVGDDNPPTPPKALKLPGPEVQAEPGGTEPDAGTRWDPGPVSLNPVKDRTGVAAAPQAYDDSRDAGPLAGLLGDEQGSSEGAGLLDGLVGLRRKPVDPMTDYVQAGIRLPRAVLAAIAHQASLTGVSQQVVLRDAVLQTEPISPALLDAHCRELYGRGWHG